MPYVNYNPYNVPVPYNPDSAPPFPPIIPTPPYVGPQHPPKGPHGKLCNDGFIVNYHGLTSDTAEVIVDNKNRYIKVNVFPEAHTPYVWEQLEPVFDWEIHHNFNGYPNITCINTEGEVIMGEIKYWNKELIHVTFSKKMAGKALLG